jgi:hypothetical protein
MSKGSLSVTLDTANVTWLKARARALGTRGVSELLDRLVTEARAETPGGAIRSVVGTIDLDPTDPMLMSATEAARSVFETSLARPAMVKERKRPYAARGSRRV